MIDDTFWAIRSFLHRLLKTNKMYDHGLCSHAPAFVPQEKHRIYSATQECLNSFHCLGNQLIRFCLKKTKPRTQKKMKWNIEGKFFQS